jgi:hypothetical protein
VRRARAPWHPIDMGAFACGAGVAVVVAAVAWAVWALIFGERREPERREPRA